MEKTEQTFTKHYWWGCTVVRYGTSYGGLFPKQFQADPLNDPAIPFVGIHPKEMKSVYERDVTCIYSIIGHNSQNSYYICQQTNQEDELY